LRLAEDYKGLKDYFFQSIRKKFSDPIEDKFKTYSKGAINLVNSLIAHYRKSLELKIKEIDFLKNENGLLRECVEMLQEVVADYEETAEQLIVDAHAPKEKKSVGEPEVFKVGNEILENMRAEKIKKDKMALNGEIEHSAFSRSG
jgi:hypothetical protein